MSAYPPGVTGNEWQIAGLPEDVVPWPLRHPCENSINLLVTLPDDVQEEREIECLYEGEVDVVIDGAWEDEVSLSFTCPRCFHEYVGEIVQR